jgi:hypothetical protein
MFFGFLLCRDASRPVRGPGGIYEGVISTYREESTVATRAAVVQQVDITTARSESGYGWDNSYGYSAEATSAATTSWKEIFVKSAFRDTPEWVRSVILNSCYKSNLFRDSATSPKLERLAHLFGDADLRVLGRGSESISSMKFPPQLSTTPVFDETVHADESDFIDCGAYLKRPCSCFCSSVQNYTDPAFLLSVVKRVLDIAVKRYRFARSELRNIQCKQLHELEHDDMARVIGAIQKESKVDSAGITCLHPIFLGEMKSTDMFQLKDRFQKFAERLFRVIKTEDKADSQDVNWQLRALDIMERANLETIQLERCRWTTRLEDETKSLRAEYELWFIKGEVDSVVRSICDFEQGRNDDSFPSGGGSELKPFLSTANGSTIELVDLQWCLLSRLIAKFEQDHELSSHSEQPLANLRSILSPTMEVEQGLDEAFLRQTIDKCIEVLREVMCNAISNMFVDDSGDDDSMEFMERIEFLQDGIRDLNLVLGIQEIRRHVRDNGSSAKLDPVEHNSPEYSTLKQALLRMLLTVEKDARGGSGAALHSVTAQLRTVREIIHTKFSEFSTELLVHGMQHLLDAMLTCGDQFASCTISMSKTAIRMLSREDSADRLSRCRYIFREHYVGGQFSSIVEHFGLILVDVLLSLENLSSKDSGVRSQDVVMDHIAFWRVHSQLIVERNLSIRHSASAAFRYVRCLDFHRRFSLYRQVELGSDNHLRKLQDEMRSILSSIDLASTRGSDHSALEIRSRLSVLQLQVKQLLITQPKLQGLSMVSEPTDVKEFAFEIVSRKSWVARFHNSLVSCLLSDTGPVGHRLDESKLLTELISNIWVDCFKRVGKKDEIERGGWMAVSTVEASHGGIKIDPTVCSQLLSASEFENVSFSHSLVGRTNQFRSSMEIFRILLGHLILRGYIYTSCAQVRKFLEWAVEQSLDCSTREVPLLLPRGDVISRQDEERLISRLPHVTEDFPFPHLLLKMISELDFIGEFLSTIHFLYFYFGRSLDSSMNYDVLMWDHLIYHSVFRQFYASRLRRM